MFKLAWTQRVRTVDPALRCRRTFGARYSRVLLLCMPVVCLSSLSYTMVLNAP